MEFTGNKEKAVSVTDLSKRVLVRWKTILICGVLVGVLGGLFTYVIQRNTLQNEETEYANTNRSEEDIKNASEFMSTVDEYISNAIDLKINYISNSIIAKLNENCYKATTIIYIEPSDLLVQNNTNIFIENEQTEENNTYSISDPKTLSIQSALEQFIYNGIDYSELKSELDVVDTVLIKELIETERYAGNLVLYFYYTDSNGADTAIRFIIEKIEDKIPEIKAIYGDFNYTIVPTQIMEELNPYINWIQNNATELKSLIDAQGTLNNVNTKLPSLSTSMQMYNYKTESISYGKILRNTILFAGLGAVGYVLVLVLYLLFSNTVMGKDDLKKYLKVNGMIVQEYTKKDIEQQYSVLIDEIDNLGIEYDKIALISDLPIEELKTVSQELIRLDATRKYILVSDPLTDLNRRNSLTGCKGAVLVSKIEKSSLAKLQEILSYVNTKDIDVIGGVVL